MILTATEVAELFGVSHKTVRTWARTGKIPAHRTPSHGWRFRHDELAEYLP